MFLLGLLLCRTFDMLRPIPLRYHILYWVTPEPFVASSLTGTTLFCYLLLKYRPSPSSICFCAVPLSTQESMVQGFGLVDIAVF